MKDNGGLTSRQQRAIVSLLECPTIEAASKNARVSRSTLYDWLNIPAFKEELERAKRQQFQAALGQMHSLVPKAIEGLKELACSSNEQVRLRACVEILKATNAYGSHLPISIFQDDSHIMLTDAHLDTVNSQILAGLIAGELPVNVAKQVVQVVEKLNNFEGTSLFQAITNAIVSGHADAVANRKSKEGEEASRKEVGIPEENSGEGEVET